MAALIRVGTSGYQYPAWRGSFYPRDLDEAAMLPFYATQFDTVEINYSFYRMPAPPALLAWAQATPPEFTLALRAPRSITHIRHLRNAEATTNEFLRRARLLGAKLGPVLFQIAPEHELDVPVLDLFLSRLEEALRSGVRAAFEFRNPDWLVEAVFDCLRGHNAALCVSDSETIRTPPRVTADFGYFRLRDEGYTQADLAQWAGLLREWDARLSSEIYVYFRHEETGRGPDFARRLRELLAPA